MQAWFSYDEPPVLMGGALLAVPSLPTQCWSHGASLAPAYMPLWSLALAGPTLSPVCRQRQSGVPLPPPPWAIARQCVQQTSCTDGLSWASGSRSSASRHLAMVGGLGTATVKACPHASRLVRLQLSVGLGQHLSKGFLAACTPLTPRSSRLLSYQVICSSRRHRPALLPSPNRS